MSTGLIISDDRLSGDEMANATQSPAELAKEHLHGSDPLVPLSKASSLIPGGPHHQNKVRRWALRGLLGRNGQRIKLKIERWGRQTFVRVSAVRELGEALTRE
jgi:hypothetical protein